MNTADDDHDVRAVDCGQSLPQGRNQRQVTGGKGGHTDDVNVVVGRLTRHLLRRLEQRADVDVEPDVRERRCDDLLPSVVAVLAHLAYEHTWAAPLVLGELFDQLGRPGEVLGFACFVAVHTTDCPDLCLMAPVDLLERLGDLGEARDSYLDLLSDYPLSPLTDQARGRLDRLDR